MKYSLKYFGGIVLRSTIYFKRHQKWMERGGGINRWVGT